MSYLNKTHQLNIINIQAKQNLNVSNSVRLVSFDIKWFFYFKCGLTLFQADCEAKILLSSRCFTQYLNLILLLMSNGIFLMLSWRWCDKIAEMRSAEKCVDFQITVKKRNHKIFSKKNTSGQTFCPICPIVRICYYFLLLLFI